MRLPDHHDYSVIDPPPLACILLNGSIAEEVDRRPYTKRDGRPSWILTWAVRCRKCPRLFYFEGGQDARYGKGSNNKHCKLHRKGWRGQKARREARARMEPV